ncbi:MAG TPA: sulfotransferase family 2 domain-containing protein [Saprospiraceae bacterium]|nr:sulfotransferase family 2 domain-containing protein [Saprospiraceae bacterium]HRW76651.1 sulfotransferase family 2 domain-containing protein [Saprospiraceae bacterium]
MLNQLFKRSRPSVRHQLELISIHIPKTAGTSFRNSLEGVYGKEEVIRLDIGLVRQEVRVWETIYEEEQLPARTKVVHGHFSYPLLTRHFTIDPAVPVITWLRDPVKRVVSNYLYLAKRLAEELKEEERGLNILKKMQRSLIEYASYEPSQNRMSKFLEGLDLERMAFVGLVESYDEDLAHLAARLGWEDYPVFHHNRTGKSSDAISAQELDLIRSLNQDDIRLYERAQDLRAKGHWQS